MRVRRLSNETKIASGNCNYIALIWGGLKRLFRLAIFCLAIHILTYVLDWPEHQRQTRANRKRISRFIDCPGLVAYIRMIIVTYKIPHVSSAKCLHLGNEPTDIPQCHCIYGLRNWLNSYDCPTTLMREFPRVKCGFFRGFPSHSAYTMPKINTNFPPLFSKLKTLISGDYQ